jgi:hypothetical protein
MSTLTIERKIMMTQVSRGLWAGVLMMCSHVAGAAPQTPAPQPQNCQVMGSQNNLDFGTQSRAGLAINNRGKLTPGQRAVRINVMCRFPRKMVLNVVGNATGQQFGWGDGAKVRIEIQDAELDNKPTLLSRLQSNGQVLAGSAPMLTLSPGDYFTPSAEAGQITGKQLTFTLTAEPELDNNRVTFNQPYSGQSLLTIRLE